jgi:hypothetical protein
VDDLKIDVVSQWWAEEALLAEAMGNAGQISGWRRTTKAFSCDFETQIADRTERDATAANRSAIDPSRQLESQTDQDGAVSKRAVERLLIEFASFSDNGRIFSERYLANNRRRRASPFHQKRKAI